MNDFQKQTFIPIENILIETVDHLDMFDPPKGFMQSDDWWRCVDTVVQVNLQQKAKFQIETGNRIKYSYNSDISIDDVQSLLMSTPFGALIHQRGELPIHGAGLVAPNDGGVTILCGSVGAGKSTTSALLCSDGWKLLADDICRLQKDLNNTEGGLLAHRGYVKIKLTPDAVNRLNISIQHLRPVNTQTEKFYWRPINIAEPLYFPKRIIILHRPASVDQLDWAKCSGEVAISALAPHVYRIEIGIILQLANLTNMLRKLVETVPVYVLFIPPNAGPRMVADEIAKFIDSQNSSVHTF